jgi:cytochrome c-type biogenesis protein
VLFGALERHLWGPVALAAGLAASFAGVGIALALVGFNVGINPGTLRLVVAALMGAAGIVLLVPALQGRVASMASPLAGKGQILFDRLQPTGIWGQFALGAMLGVIWSPCSGPTLGAAIGLAAQGDDLGRAAATMSAFALGAATPILLLAYGSRRAIMARRDWMARASRIGKPLMGAAFFGIGLFVLTGLDKIVETSLTNAMPEWLVNVTTRL